MGLECETALMSVSILERELFSETEAARLLDVVQNALHYRLEDGRTRGRRIGRSFAAMRPRARRCGSRRPHGRVAADERDPWPRCRGRWGARSGRWWWRGASAGGA